MAAKKPAKEKLSRDPVELVEFVENIKKQWMATIDALVDPLMIVRPDYTISKANRAMAELHQSNVKDILGKKCYTVFANRKSPCPGCQLKKTAKELKPQSFQLSEVRDDRFYEVASQPVFDTTGELDGLVHVYRDRTEAKNMERQLLQTEKLASIGLLAGGVAHEINNPLGGILIFSQMLMREMEKTSPHLADVKEIEAAAQRCKSIVENLLDFARQQPVKKSDQLEDVDIVEAAQTALRFGKVSLKAKRTKIIEDWDLESVTIKANRNKLIQVFLNLIQNALQSMPGGGKLTLRSYMQQTKAGRMAAIEVSDSGVGIPKEHLKKIFDPFFTTKEPGEGTGLGLAICYGIIQDLGGDIEVESRVNNGSTFRILLPAGAGSSKRSA